MNEDKENLYNIIDGQMEKDKSDVSDFDRLFGGLTDEEKEKIINNLYSGLQHFAYSISMVIEEYHNKIINTFHKIAPLLEKLYQILDNLYIYPAKMLGQQQFVWWEALPEDILQSIANAETEENKMDIIKNWILLYNPDKVIARLDEIVCLKDWAVYKQSIDAYNREKYEIAAMGLTACFDRMLSLYSGESTHKIEDRVNKFIQHFRDLQQKGKKLENEDYIALYLYITLSATIKQFGKSIPFTKTEPQGLNRHWIMHGRMERNVTKVDCNKLINLLYGLYLMNEMIEEWGND